MRVYKVSEITDRIRRTLNDEFSEMVWIKGEISNLTHHTSGHTYFSLKDDNALIKCVLFKNLSFKSSGLEEGLEIAGYGRIDIYSRASTYQLVVQDWQPLGRGFYTKLFEEIKSRLEKKGYFDEERKRPLPYYCSKVGIATSQTGAAFRDIVRVIWSRNPNTGIVLAPCQVQGEGSAQSIVEAIEILNEYGQLDVIIVGRGGGSVEDLWSFNEEEVATAIFNSKVPVVSAVGHEVDFTIADFVADVRAPTPSTAGEMVSRDVRELFGDLNDFKNTLYFYMDNSIKLMKDEIMHFSNHRNLSLPEKLIDEGLQTIDVDMEKMDTLINGTVDDKLKELLDIKKDLGDVVEMLISESEGELRHFEKQLDILDYSKTMKRGFAILNDGGGEVVFSVEDVKDGDRLSARLYDGELNTLVEDVKSYEE